MSNSAIDHIPHDQLLPYMDGELPARRAKEIRSHLEACWQCRTELEDLQNVVGDCVRYRKNVLQSCLPPPPSPWGDIYQGFARIEAARNDVPWLIRSFHGLMAGARRWHTWAPAAVAVALIFILISDLRKPQVAQAAELLRKAVVASQTRPAAVRRVRIRTSKFQLTRTVGVKNTSQEWAGVRELLDQAHFDADDPLSARSFQAWRDQAGPKKDQVVEDSGTWQILTAPQSGPIRQATLKLNQRDFEPVAERLDFHNNEFVEITPASVELPSSLPGITSSEHRGGEAVAPDASPAPPVITPATAGDELQVVAALHRMGADLGEPVEVRRSGDKVLVSGIGLSAERQRQIRAAVDPLPHVSVQFSEPSTAMPSDDATQPPSPPTMGEMLQFQTRIERLVGGRTHFREFSGQAIDMSETMMSRAYALRRLAEQFPKAAELELTSQNRQLLADVVRDHASVLARQVRELDRLARPVLVPLGGTSAAPRSTISGDGWQTATERVFQDARTMEKALAQLLGMSPIDGSGAQLPSDVLSKLGQLRADSEAYEHIAITPLH